MKRKIAVATPKSLQFFAGLKWIDGKALLPTIEPYRRRLFASALDTIGPDGFPVFNFVLVGRAKKNFKTTDLVLGALFKLTIADTPHGSDGFILANDEGQAADDLSLAKKLVSVNPILARELEPLQKEIRRRDGRGVLKILPAQNVVGQHGKTASFIGFDEIHGYKTYDLFEALAPDPTRQDTLTWITSYDTIYNSPGIPLFDFKQIGFAGTDPRMLFSWYSGDRCTDPAFADLQPEQRANPSMESWSEGPRYLEQQKRRLPSHKYRRLHLNLPGAPNGAFLEQGLVIDAVETGCRVRHRQPDVGYYAFCDMSGGSSDDACLAIAHAEGGFFVLDLVVKQNGPAPFNPRSAVAKFCDILREWGISMVTGDNYAGTTFAHDFEERGFRYRKSHLTATEIYEAFEPRLNAGEVRLLDEPTLVEQLLTLVVKGAKITHETGSHDDHANAACGAINLAAGAGRGGFAVIDAGGRMIWSEGGTMKVAQLGDDGEPIGPTHTVSQEELGLSPLDRSRRAALGPNWRSLIPSSDPAYRRPE